MDEKQTDKIRPTKKQLLLLEFIKGFIQEHGYSPSYREIMSGMNYTSVATVALHVNSLIARGHLVKRGRSARSLELAEPSESKLVTNQVKPGEEKWLVEKIERKFVEAESNLAPSSEEVARLELLVEALKVLNLEAAASSFAARLPDIRSKLASSV